MPIERKNTAAGESITEVHIRVGWKAEGGQRVNRTSPWPSLILRKLFDLPASHAGTLVKILLRRVKLVAVGTSSRISKAGWRGRQIRTSHGADRRQNLKQGCRRT